MKMLVFLISLSASLMVPVLSSERIYTYTDAIPQTSNWVGQQVMFSVVIAMDERPQGSPRFTIPDVPGGILLEISGRPTYGKEKKNGAEFSTWRYDFAFYPQRDGTHTIPSIGVRLSLPDGEGNWQYFTATTTKFTLDAKWPKGAEGLSSLVSTKRFDATEKWNPDISTPRVGDAITLTISRNADDVLGLGFPPLDWAEIEGMGVYPATPEVDDQIYRGEVTGKRTEKITYTFEREGTVTIPGYTIPWFNLSEQKMKYVRFPARTFEVAPNPTLLNNAAETPTSTSASIPWKKVLGVVGGLLAMAFLIHRYLLPALARRAEQYKYSESAAFQKIRRVCHKGNATATSNALRLWLRHLNVSLEQFLLEADSPNCLDQIRLLNDKLYVKSSQNTWNPITFLKTLSKARKNFLRSRRRKNKLPANQTTKTLIPLNPSYQP